MKTLFVGYDEDNKRLELTVEDLQTHVHGIGASRSGKSKLIEWLCRELVRNRQGFCLIDPHGSVYDDVLRWLTYLQPKRDIILFNPSETGRIVGFNPFRRSRGEVGVQVDRRVIATMKAWGARDTNDTPRLERWLRALYSVLIHSGHPIDVSRYLVSWAEKDIRDYLVRALPAGFARSQWEEIAAYKNPRDFADQIESTRNRLYRFLDRQQLQRIMAAASGLDFERMIEGGQILLVNLQPSDVLTRENGRLLGSLLLNELWEYGMRRKVPPGGGEAAPPWFVIIDECQEFLTPDVDQMLDQAAKRGIHLMLFHQHLSQLEEEDRRIAEAVMTNARIKLVFGGLSRADARRMAEEIYPGQVDLQRVKFVLEQTKFWPVYTREKVYGSSTGGGEVSVSGSAETSGESWDPGRGAWVPSSSSTTSGSSASSSSWSEGVQDIPFLMPVPFKEASSVQLWSLEELLREAEDRLMEQYQRHFMIRRPGRKTVAAVTPYVKPFFVREERLAAYVAKQLAAYPAAEEVDRAIAALHADLRLKAAPGAAVAAPDDVWMRPLDGR